MKKSVLAGMLAAVMLLSGCSGVSQEKYTSLSEENKKLQQQISSLQSDNSELEGNNTTLKSENEQLTDNYEKLKKEAEPYLQLSEAERAAEMERLQKEEDERKAKEEAARQEEEAKGYETGITFDDISRSPEKYKGKKVKFSGYVLQVIEGYVTNSIRMSTNGRYDDVILVDYKTSLVDVRLLEGDEVVVYGAFSGMETYTTVMGSSVTVPLVNADIMSLDGEIGSNDTSQPTEISQNPVTYSVLYDDEYVNISFCGIEKYSNKECVTYMIENKNDFAIEVWSSTVALDGIDLGEMSGNGNISPKSKGKVYFYKDDKSNIDNKNPSTVSGSLILNSKGSEKIDGKTYYEISFYGNVS